MKIVLLFMVLFPIMSWTKGMRAAMLYSLTEQGLDKEVGSIVIHKFKHGIKIVVSADDLPISSKLGFQIYEKNSPEPKYIDGQIIIGGGFGGHWDPKKTNKHSGPNNHHKGHKGDLPQLIVKKDGSIRQIILVDDINLGDISGKALVIHENSDNYTDDPVNGGSGQMLYAAIFK